LEIVLELFETRKEGDPVMLYIYSSTIQSNDKMLLK